MNRRIKVLYNGTLGLMKYIVCMKSATDIPTNFKDWSVCLFKTKALNNPTYVKIVFWTITNKYRILYLSFSRADAQHLEYNQNCATVVKLTWLKISYVKAWWVSEIIYTLIKYIHVCIKGLSGRFCRIFDYVNTLFLFNPVYCVEDEKHTLLDCRVYDDIRKMGFDRMIY